MEGLGKTKGRYPRHSGSWDDLADRDGELLTILNPVDVAVADPDHPIRRAQHLEVMSGGYNGHSSLLAQAFQDQARDLQWFLLCYQNYQVSLSRLR